MQAHRLITHPTQGALRPAIGDPSHRILRLAALGTVPRSSICWLSRPLIITSQRGRCKGEILCYPRNRQSLGLPGIYALLALFRDGLALAGHNHV